HLQPGTQSSSSRHQRCNRQETLPPRIAIRDISPRLLPARLLVFAYSQPTGSRTCSHATIWRRRPSGNGVSFERRILRTKVLPTPYSLGASRLGLGTRGP